MADYMDNKTGMSPTERSQEWILAQAAKGDMVFACLPPTVNTVAANMNGTRRVRVQLRTAGGDIHYWFTGDIATGCSIADTGASGTATIPSTTLSFVNGEAIVDVTKTGTWSAADTDTLTIAAATIMGKSVTSVTSVETAT